MNCRQQLAAEGRPEGGANWAELCGLGPGRAQADLSEGMSGVQPACGGRSTRMHEQQGAEIGAESLGKRRCCGGKTE